MVIGDVTNVRRDFAVEMRLYIVLQDWCLFDEVRRWSEYMSRVHERNRRQRDRRLTEMRQQIPDRSVVTFG